MVKKSKSGESFSEWFDEVLSKAEVYDYGRYPVKGCGVWMPYGFQIRRRVIEIIRRILDSTGHEEVLFPILIPEDLLAKEKEHIRGFEAEVYWVTHGGKTPLDVKLALRPTSETAISLFESYWLKSYKQLPKKYYQIVSIFRYETKATKPMIRVREVTTFKEAHTAHASFEDAERQILEAIKAYKEFFDTLGIPYIISKRPEWDKFAGAIYTIAFDTLMPDGRAMQIGTVHLLGQNFSKAFEVRIQLEDESIDYIWQTSYGISERVVAALIAVHGDDRGLILPPIVAPIHVVIVPIWTKGTEELVMRYAKNIMEKVKSLNYNVLLDDRKDVGPGYKFYEWEIKGVPVRIEVGPKEMRENTFTIVRRDTLKRKTYPVDEIEEVLKETLEDIYKNIIRRSKEDFKSKIFKMNNIDEAKRIINKRLGIVEMPWCGKAFCALELADILEAKTLGTPISCEEDVNVNDKCVICGNKAITYMRLAKTY